MTATLLARRPGTALLRRAGLADVPAVARLLDLAGAPDLPDGHLCDADPRGGAGARARLLRLVLTHVGLDRGQVWLADDAGSAVGAVALLPPAQAGGAADARLELALRLGLGGPLPVPVPACDAAAWVLVPVVPHAREVLPLLRRALAAHDAAGGAPVLALGQPHARTALAWTGFGPGPFPRLLLRA